MLEIGKGSFECRWRRRRNGIQLQVRDYIEEKTWPFPEVTLKYGLVLEAALGFRMEALEEMGI
jgi:hypothetical protein